ncbi:GNAT family N-acetyltransferase [Nonomuraea terrae]|uniref:GNAT family N-acetyltransferase n=1 Tax=Nonomuraea terrae TaxID=2530383 RepID=A0A4R4YZ66_9ACTN|nr:GNAT family N-acetyltransferase [Nonomuraea terrae]TDD50855.1 GNAT family N-acetyltransferase [Nonomuraea terrae]
MTTIRRATADDAPTLRALMRELAENQGHAAQVAVSVDRLADLLTRPDVGYLIAERDGKAIGYVSWLQRVSFWSGQDYLALDDLYVCSEERGAKVGEHLMRAISEVARRRVIRWEVAEANVAAQRFYRRIGATLVSKKICRLVGDTTV